MRSPSSFIYFSQISHSNRLLLVLAAGLAAAFTTGCGGGSSSTSTVPANTTVTVLASSTANDQLSIFDVKLTGLTLTNKSGKTITVFSTPMNAEFMHLNGEVEPLTTVSIPQDVYTSATIISSAEGSSPTCVGQKVIAGENVFNSAIGSSISETVNLPSPITVSGTGIGLMLNLQIAAVPPFDCIYTTGANSITGTFELTPVTFAASPTNSTNGKATGLHGSISTVTAEGAAFSVTGAINYALNGPTWQVSTSSSTVFQGISSSSQLATGMPVDMDVAIQADGSLRATRVAVYDANPTKLSFSTGPLFQVAASVPVYGTLQLENQGPLLQGMMGEFNFASAAYQTSGQLTNAQNLPFTASFTATNMVAGQNVFTTTHALSENGSNYPPATTITLIPQTLNGTVSAVSSSGSFTTYTVTLAAYDLFPDFAIQPGQTPLLTNPNTVVVYADSNTQQINTDPIAVGSVLRFNGLVFNDNGTLRMDCAQINDGVAE